MRRGEAAIHYASCLPRTAGSNSACEASSCSAFARNYRLFPAAPPLGFDAASTLTCPVPIFKVISSVALARCFFGPRAFAEGRFRQQLLCIHQHWRCIFPFIALQNLGVQTFADTVAHAAH
jgi:hypothetical protein